MLQALVECRKRKLAIKRKTLSIKKETTPFKTSGSVPPTTSTYSDLPSVTSHQLPPVECQLAVNLTEYWRSAHKGTNIQQEGRYHCDTKNMTDLGRPWFRFTGSAGDMLLDRCPPENSCGAYAGLWTDSDLPSVVGVEVKAEIYGSSFQGCKWAKSSVSVMRCSNDNSIDVVYKYTGENLGCSFAFCGMSNSTK